MILRRLYLYLVSAASLALLAAGLCLLGATVLLFVFDDPSAQQSRTQLAAFTAMTLVALPVWGIHFWFARRFALRDPHERASAIRRLYLYLACLALSVGATIALAITLGDLLRPVLDRCTLPLIVPLGKPGLPEVGCPPTQTWLTISQTAWALLVLGALWAFHFRAADRDFAAVGADGVAATLRRWYMYPALLIGLLMVLSGASNTIALGWLRVLNTQTPAYQFVYMGDTLGLTIAGALLWSVHSRAIAVRHGADDRHSTLRALQGFIAVAIGMAVALVGASQILYYLLARVLGVNDPGGVAGNDVLSGLAMPGSLLLVYGAAWLLVRRRLARDAGTQEADRQAAIRRLYNNLACLVSLAAWAIGAGGVLWTLAEQIEAPLIGVNPSSWRDPLSLWVTLLVAGAAVWAAHWRPSPWAADRQSLSRRLYVWAALLASVLVLLGAGVGLLTSLFTQVFSAHPRLADPSNLDFGHYLAVMLVAAAVGLYHWRILRADVAARPPKIAMHKMEAEPVAAAGPDTAPAPSAPPAPREFVTPETRRYILAVTDATDDDVHQALGNLPPHAGYQLTPADEGAG